MVYRRGKVGFSRVEAGIMRKDNDRILDPRGWRDVVAL